MSSQFLEDGATAQATVLGSSIVYVVEDPAGSPIDYYATKDNFLKEYLKLAGGTMTGNIAMGTNKITGLGDPTADQDAATKKYVDDNAGGSVTPWTDNIDADGFDLTDLGRITLRESALGSLGATETISLTTADFFTATLDDNTSITFSNPPASGQFQKFTVHFTQDAGGGNTPTFTDTIVGSPTFNTGSNEATIITFYTFDGGTNYYAFNSTLDALTDVTGSALTDGSLWIGNGSAVAAEVAISGDITISNAGVAALASGSIVNADVNASAAIAYSKLNLTGALVIADHSASGTPSSSTFLRGDNTWATPAGSGDMVLADAQTVTGAKTFGSAGDVGKLILAGSTSGTTILNAAAVAGSGTVVLPTTGTLSTLAGTETLTNKTLTSPTLTTPALGTPASGVLTNCTGLPTTGLVDDAVTLDKIASGTDGELITWDSSGNPATVAVGTSGHVLTSNGAGAAPTFQAAGGSGFWAELDRGDLSGGAADTLTVSFTAKKYLRVLIWAAQVTGTLSQRIRFNSDSGNNYAYRASANSSDSSATSQADIYIGSATNSASRYTVIDIINISAQEKIVNVLTSDLGAAGAGTAPSIRYTGGKWANTSAQISSITLVNTGTGDFNTTTEMVVLGSD